jgi:PAB1-binding protein PBP1
VNVEVESTLLAANIGQGTITAYGTLPADASAKIDITAATGGATLVNTTGTLLAGHQHSVFLTDNGAAVNSYEVTILEDQQVAAAGGHSAFRFLNQAPKTGAIDVYMIPSGNTLANTIPLVSGLPVGGTAGYISFTSQTVTMVVTPTGVQTPKYTSQSLALTGGEVRTILIVDTQLTSNPPVEVFTANDVN